MARHLVLAFMAVMLPLLIWLHLLPALLSLLLVHELVHLLAPKFFFGRGDFGRAKVLALIALLVVLIGLLSAAVVGLVVFFQSEAGSLTNLLQKMAEILQELRAQLPQAILKWVPASANYQDYIVGWLRNHAEGLQQTTGALGHALVTSVIGMVIGALLAMQEVIEHSRRKVLAQAFAESAARLALAFRRIVFAQVRISLINTIFTTLYLAVALPVVGITLPLIKTMIAVTFLAGLLPVVGNLISNTVIVIISLSHSLEAAIASLVFLIVIHKVEYFINARIVGGQIKASAYELLSAMLLMEAAFGLPGIVAAPIFYAYFKTELAERNLV